MLRSNKLYTTVWQLQIHAFNEICQIYLTVYDMFLTKIPIAPCYCQMMGRTLKEEIKIAQYNNPTKAGKYSLEDLFRASDNIPHHYPKF